MVSLFYIPLSITSIIIILSSLFSSNYRFFEAAQAHSVTIRADSVIASILVGRQTAWIAYAPPPSNKLYVINEGSDDIYVINGTTNKVIKNIPVGDHPRGVAYDSSSNNIYVANSADGTVSVINKSTDTVISTITLPSFFTFPRAVLHPIANTRSDTVSVIDPTTNSVNATIPTASGHTGIAYNTNNNHIYVANNYSKTVSVIHP
jgi:YVTN family beta-propeller protein